MLDVGIEFADDDDSDLDDLDELLNEIEVERLRLSNIDWKVDVKKTKLLEDIVSDMKAKIQEREDLLEDEILTKNIREAMEDVFNGRSSIRRPYAEVYEDMWDATFWY